MRRKRKQRPQIEVELNVTAMLDMAFQLLAFFVLSYQPSPVEGQIAMRMPPATPLAKPSAMQPAVPMAVPLPEATIDALNVRIVSDLDGKFAGARIEQEPPLSMAGLERDLNKKLTELKIYKQVTLHVDPRLHWGELMFVMEICSRVKLASGEQLSSLGIVPIVE